MTTQTETQARNTPKQRGRIQLSELNEPGAYICEWSGHLLRVPEDAIAPGRSPLMDIVGKEEPCVCKISNNPYITRTKARLIAADADLDVNF